MIRFEVHRVSQESFPGLFLINICIKKDGEPISSIMEIDEDLDVLAQELEVKLNYLMEKYEVLS